MNLLSKISGAKDSLVSSTVKNSFLAPKLKNYGEVLSFELDSGNKTMSASVLLHGEDDPVDVTVGKYLIRASEGGGSELVLEDINASRPWLTALAGDMLSGTPIPLPADIPKAMLDMLG